MIRRVQTSTAKVLVEDAHGAAPTVPFWRGEAPGRTPELSQYVSDVRQKVHEMLSHSNVDVIAQTLMIDCGLDKSGAEQIVAYILEGRAILGAVPTQKTIIAERFFDESGGMQLVIHAPFGARINKAWGLALRKRFCRSFNLELQAAATDDGLNISLTEQHSFPLDDVFKFLHPNTVEDVLTQAAFASPLFGTRWRWDAMRALAIRRFEMGKKVPIQILRMRAEDLLAAVFPDAAACQDNIVGPIEFPNHPLVNETMKDVLQEAMDMVGLKQLIGKIQSGEIECLAVDTTTPSAFSHEILNSNPYAYLDDAPLEERRARAVTMRRVLPDSVLSEVGMLDAAAINEVVEQCWPDIRTADELHDTLLSVIVMPESLDLPTSWFEFLEELLLQGRAGIASIDGIKMWFAAERSAIVNAAYSSAEILRMPASVEQSQISAEDACWTIVRGWMPYTGPINVPNLSARLKLLADQIEAALLRLESSGSILRGKFTNPNANPIEWCDRRVLARIHRHTLGTLRKQIEPVTAAQYMRWLFRWQHVARGTQLRGERGLSEVLRQLQGFEIPARAWESDVLARRVSDYNPGLLDKLCWSGLIGWGRFSSPASVSNSRRTIPSTAAPITFFLREECDHLMGARASLPTLNPEAWQVLESLKEHGASFLSEIVRFTSLSKASAESALWELVTMGLVTADGFDSLRSLLDHRRKSRTIGRAGAGRWSLLRAQQTTDPDKNNEAICKMLLERYGVVFRDVLQRETLLPRWRELQVAFRRLEDRGEVRGGRFVSGFAGEQFALPLAVDSLRAIRKIEPCGDIVTISAADPLNLVGTIVPGERVSAVSKNIVTFRDGVAVSETIPS
jgi:ATP-dependent Lhr-like helicase